METLTSTNKKAQIWGTDLMIAAMIFSIAIVFFYLYSINTTPETENSIQTLGYEGGSISNMILSEGYPNNWDETNIIELGILTEGKINEEKLEKFYNLSRDDYERTKQIFNTPYDYYFFLDENMTIQGITREGIGKPGITKDNINAENLIKISRITIYKNKIIGATLYLWD